MFDHFQNMFGLMKIQIGRSQVENLKNRLFGKKNFLVSTGGQFFFLLKFF